jgi:predicted phosphodiesterase
MKEYVLITDPHFTASSNVRAGDYLADLLKKLEYVIEKANAWDATIIIAGDVFDKPTVADFVKSALIEVLKKAKYVPYAIFGNHDTLFNSREKDYKTSMNLMCIGGHLRRLEYEEFEDHILTNRPAIVNAGKPQIGIYHGFLNKEDGLNTFLYDQIQTDDQCIVCLGHDHVEYEPVPYRNTTIFRIGALIRAIRNDSEKRIPKMLRIRITDKGTIATKLYDVECKSCELIFKEKMAKADPVTYTDVINQIKGVTNKDMTLEEALPLVASAETSAYLVGVLRDLETVRESK